MAFPLLIVCAPLLARAAQKAPAATLLQVAQRSQSSRGSMPTGFFADSISEDAAPSRQEEFAFVPPSAPFDVGTGAVPLPKLASAEGWTALDPQAQRPPQHVSFAQAPSGTVASSNQHSFFDDEDSPPTRQVFSGLPSGAKPPPTALQQQAARIEERRLELLAQQAAMQKAALQSATQDSIAEQKAMQAIWEQAAQSTPAPAAMQAQEEMPTSPPATPQDPASFFESMGDVGGQEEPVIVDRTTKAAGSASTAAEDAAQQADQQVAEITAQPQIAVEPQAPQKEEAAFTQISSDSAAAAKSDSSAAALRAGEGSQVDAAKAIVNNAVEASASTATTNNGHSITGSVDLKTGEKGEDIQTFVNPALLKLMFPAKPEKMLEQERKILATQDKLALEDAEVKKTFAKLKAATYHSANMSRYRLGEQKRLETSLKRTKLLEDANRYKAQLEQDERRKSQEMASLERTVHLAGASADGDREAREQLDMEYRDEAAKYAEDIKRVEAAEEEPLAALREEQRIAQEQEAKLIANVTDALRQAGADGLDSATSKLQQWGNRVEEGDAAQARRAEEFRNYLYAADAAATGGMATNANSPCGSGAAMPCASMLQPPAPVSAVQSSAQSGYGNSYSELPMTPTIQRAPEFVATAPYTIRQPALGGMPKQRPTIGSFAQVDASVRSASKPAYAPAVSVVSQNAATSALNSQQSAALARNAQQSMAFAQAATGAAAAAAAASSQSSAASQSSTSSYQPSASCTPQCTWKCESPKCDEVCEPVCETPVCETRCSSPDISKCHMECTEPHCSVLCPQSACPSFGCPVCRAQCDTPSCKLQCPQDQDCRNECEQPKCTWKCRAPTDCPAPSCSMFCEQPKNCMGSTYQQLPPLQPGEVSVKSFSAPISLGQVSSSRSPSSLRGASLLQAQTGHSVPVHVNYGNSSSLLMHMPVKPPQRMPPARQEKSLFDKAEHMMLMQRQVQLQRKEAALRAAERKDFEREQRQQKRLESLERLLEDRNTSVSHNTTADHNTSEA